MSSPAFLTPIVQQHGQRFLRYAGVSVIGVILGQGLLVLFYSGFGFTAVMSNLAASTVASGPAYVLNRYWVWRKTTKNLFWSEIMPFWGIAVVGLVISTVFVALVSKWHDTVYAVNLASLAAYGVVWVGKYFVLNHVLFAGDHTAVARDPETTASSVAP